MAYASDKQNPVNRRSSPVAPALIRPAGVRMPPTQGDVCYVVIWRHTRRGVASACERGVRLQSGIAADDGRLYRPTAALTQAEVVAGRYIER